MLTSRDQAVERLLMGLRLAEGIPAAALAAAGVPSRRLSDLAAEGLLTIAGDRVAATAAGRRLLDGVLRELLRGANALTAAISSRPRSAPAAAQSPSGRWV
jgi:oxygen-independent coproporphyrinogen-3 oxidase